MKHLLVTNDYPPKIGGIQSYLWELWRRLPPEDVTVLTTPHSHAAAFDAAQQHRIVRTRQKWLLPTRVLAGQINRLIDEVDPAVVLLDPALPLAYLGPALSRPYAVIVHGAEFVIPSALPVARQAMSRVLSGCSGIVGSGDYVADAVAAFPAAAGKPIVALPPGVDCERFSPISSDKRAEIRSKMGASEDTELVLGVSRLVPRKGFDRLVEAAASLRRARPRLQVFIGGTGRDSGRLQRLIDRRNAPVTLMGRIPEDDLPSFYGAADVFCMPCHDRWFGLEREGFGIVFVEAAAAGVPSVAGLSGGSAEAVLHGTTGLVVKGRVTSAGVAGALDELLKDPGRRAGMAVKGRERAVEHFNYDTMAVRLHDFIAGIGSSSPR